MSKFLSIILLTFLALPLVAADAVPLSTSIAVDTLDQLLAEIAK